MRHPRRLWGFHGHQKERGWAAGAVLGEKGSPSAVLTDDFLAGSDDRMTDGRKKRKGFHWFGLERSISDLSYFRLTPVGSDWR